MEKIGIRSCQSILLLRTTLRTTLEETEDSS
jgi:hypothetical protein